MSVVLEPSLSYPGVRVLLLDIEGTTTPSVFVYDVLFPYVRRRLRKFLQERQGDRSVSADLDLLHQEYERDREQGLSPPLWKPEDSPQAPMRSLASYVEWLMEQDRKSAPLKSLQGKIWEEGYRSGELKGQVYPDVPPALKRWRHQGKEICIYSSGSVLAQKLLFSHADAGDLTPYLRSYFDTTMGSKKDALSYQCIAEAICLSPGQIFFLSDATAELDAARRAGTKTGLCVRGESPVTNANSHPIVRTLDQVFP